MKIIIVNPQKNTDRLRSHAYSKGAGTTAGTIMLIVIFAIFFSIYLYMTNAQVQSTIQLNLESLSLMKLKSTFSLFNNSLGTTWFISTVQAIFMTGDESIGCGIDDPLAERLPEGYWYMRDPLQDRDGLVDAQGNPIERIPNTEKYNAFGRNPQICYPRDNHVLEYLQTKLECEGLLNIKTPIDAGGVSITIGRERNVCNGNNKAFSLFQLSLNDDSVESKFSQDVAATNQNGRIQTQTENYNKVMTLLRLMVAAAREAVENLLILGDFHQQRNPATQYTPLTANKDAYQNVIKSRVNAILTARVPSGILATTDIKTDLRAADHFVSNVVPTGLGLVIYYNAKTTYTESSEQGAAVLMFGWPTASRKLSSCYGFRKLSGEAGKFHMGIDIAPNDPNVDEAVSAVGDGTVIDLYNECPVGYYGSLCGKTGSEKYGNMALIKHDSGYYSLYAHLKKDSILATVGERVAPGQQIAVMGSSGSSTGVNLHFELRTQAASGSAINPCTRMNCQESTDKKCGTISTLPQPTSGVYYYNDESANTFVKRPVRLEYLAEDYMPALDCTTLQPDPPGPTYFTWQSANDMTCCAGYLFSCNANIPGLDSTQTLPVGTSLQDTFPQNICDNILSGAVLSCTANGFELS